MLHNAIGMKCTFHKYLSFIEVYKGKYDLRVWILLMGLELAQMGGILSGLFPPLMALRESFNS